MPQTPGTSAKLAVFAAHADVAGAGADDFDERAGCDAAADRAEMAVKRADRHGNSRGQTGFLRPRRREAADRAVNRMHARRQAGTQLRELRIELGQKFRVGITVPFRIPHRLVAGGANARDEFVGMLRAGKRGGNEIGKLHPRMRGVENFRRRAETMQQLAPEPFARINAAALGEILRAHFFRQRGDLGGLV